MSSFNTIVEAFKRENFATYNSELCKIPHPDSLKQSSNTILFVVCGLTLQMTHIQYIQLLLQKGADVNHSRVEKDPSKYKNTPLRQIVLSNNSNEVKIAVVNLLIASGADVNVNTLFLHNAVQSNIHCSEIIRILLKAGIVKTNLSYQTGKSVLQMLIACYSPHRRGPELVKIFIMIEFGTEYADKVESECLLKLKVESDRLAKVESDRLAKVESDRLARIESDRLAKVETDRLAKVESDRLARIESDRLARVESDRLAKVESECLVKTESDHLANAESDRLAETEYNRLAKVEPYRLVKLENKYLADIEFVNTDKNQPDKPKQKLVLDDYAIEKLIEKNQDMCKIIADLMCLVNTQQLIISKLDK